MYGKKILKKAALLLGCTALLLTANGKGAEAKTIKVRATYELSPNKSLNRYESIYGSEFFETYSKITMSSSNKKVLKLTKLSKGKFRYQWKKAGKTTLTTKYYKKGKKKPVAVVKTMYTVKKMQSVFSSVTLNGKDITSKYKKDNYAYGDPGTYTFKLKNGWKLSNVFLTNTLNDDETTNTLAKDTTFTLQNGDYLTLELKKGKDQIYRSYYVQSYSEDDSASDNE